QLVVELHVLLPEARVAGAHVKREERLSSRLPTLEDADERVCARTTIARGGAQIERGCSGRVGRMEVPAPGLHDGEVVEVVEGEEHRAVPSGREADQGPPASRRDRLQVRVDVVGELAGDRGLPVAAGTP